jgi:CysZ protein
LFDPITRDPIRPSRRFALVEFAQGFWLFWRGALLLFHRPEYAGRLQAPVAGNLVAAAAIALLEWWLFLPLARTLAGSDGWLGFLAPLVPWDDGTWTILLAALLPMWLAPVWLVAFSGPLVEPLADAVERSAASGPMRPVPLNGARRLALGVGAAARLGTAQVIALPLILLLASFRLGLLAVLLATAAVTTLAWLELPLVRRGRGLGARRRLLRANLARALGFGIAAEIGLLLPCLNLLLYLPSAAAGITLLHLHLDKQTEEHAMEPLPVAR